MTRGECPPQTTWRWEGGVRSRGARSFPDGHEVAKGGKLLGPNSYDVPQRFRRVEPSAALALVEDPLGEARPDAGQPREFSDRGAIEIERARVRGWRTAKWARRETGRRLGEGRGGRWRY